MHIGTAGFGLSRRDLIAGAVTSISCAAAAAPPSSRPSVGTLGAPAWQEDVTFLFEQMRRRHRNLFHHTPEQQFRAAVDRLRQQCPSMKDWQIIAGIQQVVALAGDGHSFLFASGLYRSYPFEVAWFGDEIRVVRTTPALADLLGARVLKLDDSSPDEICRRLDRTIPQAETPWYVLGQRPDRMRRAELLAAVGIAKSPDRITIEAVDLTGEKRRRVIKPMPLGASDSGLTLALGPIEPALPQAGFGWRRLAECNVVHLNFRSYEDLPERASRFFRELRAEPPRALLIDLRENSGGNYDLPRQHIIGPLQEMPALNREGKLFVLIGRKTFSAAMTNATDFRRETEALLVGEPAGARPNGFQELQTFTLPNSGLKVGCSTAAYRFGAPADKAVLPDLDGAPDWSAFRSGKDKAVDVALAYWKRSASDGRVATLAANPAQKE